MISVPVAAFHSRAVLSHEPVASVRPSGLKATAVTAFSWPRKTAISLPVAHSLTVLVEPVASVRRSGLKATTMGCLPNRVVHMSQTLDLSV
jgi:hypothetical protein